MTDIFEVFVIDLLRQLLGVLTFTLNTILSEVLYAENAFIGVIAQETIDKLVLYIYSFGVSLIIIKTLRKGFVVYIIGREGDPDSSPLEMFNGALNGVSYALSFPIVYKWFADVTLWFGNNVLTIISGDKAIQFNSMLSDLYNKGLMLSLLTLIYAICILILWIQLVGRGIELFILRLGIPIACLGLVDSDNGVFKPYIKTFYQTAFTSIIQITAMLISYMLIINVNYAAVISALAFTIVAFKAPKLIQSLLIQTGGGGGVGNKIYMTTNIVRSLKGIIK